MVIALREDASFLYTTIEPFVIQLQEYVKMTTNDENDTEKKFGFVGQKLT